MYQDADTRVTVFVKGAVVLAGKIDPVPINTEDMDVILFTTPDDESIIFIHTLKCVYPTSDVFALSVQTFAKELPEKGGSHFKIRVTAQDGTSKGMCMKEMSLVDSQNSCMLMLFSKDDKKVRLHMNKLEKIGLTIIIGYTDNATGNFTPMGTNRCIIQFKHMDIVASKALE